MRWGLAGFVIIGLHLIFALLSPRFAYGSDMLSRPIPLFVGIVILAGTAYLLVARRPPRPGHGKGLLVWIVAVGVIIRLCAAASTPVLEDDYYRYLWDGGVLANGHDPYTFSPDEVLGPEGGAPHVPPSLRRLAAESGSIVDRVNHPHLRTIYPPVAQAFFAIAHLIRPWSLFAWRLVLLGVDSLVLLLLIILLHRSNLPMPGCVIYWWNPLLVKEVFNSGHMDILAFPFVLGALWMASRERYGRSAALLALATGVKVWPVALLPVILLPLARRPRRLLPALAIFASLVSILSLPVLRSGLDTGSGFAAYSRYWEMNDALFMVLSWAASSLAPAAGLLSGGEKMATRLLVALIFVAWTLKISCRGGRRDFADLCERSLLIVAALFLLSPTQFPWYSLWILPFLTIRPRTSLLLLTVLLPVYYLRFTFRAMGNARLFDIGIVWVEYVPVWILLIREWYSTRKGSRRPEGRSPVYHAAKS